MFIVICIGYILATEQALPLIAGVVWPIFPPYQVDLLYNKNLGVKRSGSFGAAELKMDENKQCTVKVNPLQWIDTLVSIIKMSNYTSY